MVTQRSKEVAKTLEPTDTQIRLRPHSY